MRTELDGVRRERQIGVQGHCRVATAAAAAESDSQSIQLWKSCWRLIMRIEAADRDHKRTSGAPAHPESHRPSQGETDDLGVVQDRVQRSLAAAEVDHAEGVQMDLD